MNGEYTADKLDQHDGGRYLGRCEVEIGGDEIDHQEQDWPHKELQECETYLQLKHTRFSTRILLSAQTALVHYQPPMDPLNIFD
jgi:hypothetical protein